MEGLKIPITMPESGAITLVPICDVQLGAQGADERLLRRVIEETNSPHTYYLGLGDYIDAASPSNRQALRSVELYDSIEDLLEQGAEAAVKRFLLAVAGTAGRWLGILEGHHYYTFRDGKTSDQKIADALQAPFLGTSAFIRLLLYDANKLFRGRLDIWCHHGHGWGTKQASPINKLESLIGYFEADIYLIGHYHRRIAIPIDRLYLDKGGRIRNKTAWLICAGSFLRGYQQGSTLGGKPSGGYVERRMLLPAALGSVSIHVDVHRTERHNDVMVSVKV